MPKNKKSKLDIGVTQEIKQAVGALIRAERKRGDHAVQRVADRLGITREALTQIESGRSNVNAVQLWILASTLNCRVEDLFPRLASEEMAITRVSKADMEEFRKKDERAPKWATALLREELDK